MEDPIMIQSAVRLPTPPPLDALQEYASSKRKRSPPSRSPSPPRRKSPPRGPARAGPILQDVDPQRAMERDRQLADRRLKQEEAATPPKPRTEEEKQAAAKVEYEKLLNVRSGGTYIPPARLRALQAQITDKSSKEYQRMAWEALKKSINGLINKVNVSNIKYIVPELFGENLVRGRGLFCRSIMKAQAASLPFTPIYAAMVAIVNTKLPQVGELLLNRLIVQFKKAFKRNDKAVCLSSTTFIAHLCNQQVVHEMVAAQILFLLLNKPTDDSVEIAVGLTREIGQHLEEMSGPIALVVFDQFRSILHEQDIDKRVQYMIEVLFQVRKDKYKDNPAIKEELDLVEEEDQITHRTGLDDEIEVQDSLNVFKFDPEWEENEAAYKKLKAEILGEADGSDEDDEDDSGDSSDDEEAKEERELEIKDQSNTDLVNLRRTIYLTIMSSIDFEECCHKLMKVTLPPGQEPELPSMVIECCSQERTYSKFYGLIGERFSKLNRLWTELFEASFTKYFDTIHRYETNRLRNIARFFGHMLSSDAIGWHVLSIVHLNEDETTSSSRIFIKILFQDLAEALGMAKLQARLKDDVLRPSYAGIFPTDNARNTRFSINYFTSIGMGALTEEMREHLKNLPKPALPTLPAAKAESDSDSVSSYSSYTGSSRSYSRSPSPTRNRRGRSYTRSASRTPSRKAARARSITPSRSPSPPPRRRRSSSTPPPPRRARSLSRTPPRKAPARSPSPYRNGRPPITRRSYSRSPPRRNGGPLVRTQRRSLSRSITPPPRRGHAPRRASLSRSPPPRRAPPRRDSSSRSRSRSPPPRRGPPPRAARSVSPLPYRSGRRPSRSVTPPRGAYRRRASSSVSAERERGEGRRAVRRNTSSSASEGFGGREGGGGYRGGGRGGRGGGGPREEGRRRSPSYEAGGVGARNGNGMGRDDGGTGKGKGRERDDGGTGKGKGRERDGERNGGREEEGSGGRRRAADYL
ncbi:pre-mRNA-splicing factor cwc22 [Xylographa carneopallida]|nr:pre-mRNA-splicing factor cwc22 [Xylographa carneopallida]